MISVLLVDDYAPWRQYIGATLAADPELKVVGEAADGLEAIAKAGELKPDVVLLDISLPDLNGLAVALRISEQVPLAKILILSQQNDEDLVDAALNAGASGFVLKTARSAELLSAIRCAFRGEARVGPADRL